MSPPRGADFWHNSFCMVSGKSGQLHCPALRHLALALGFLLVCGVPGLAQDAVPAVNFNFSFPGSQPEHYDIWVPLSGSATYESDGKLTANSDSDAFRVDFAISEATRTRIFDLTKRANYFDGELDSKKKVWPRPESRPLRTKTRSTTGKPPTTTRRFRRCRNSLESSRTFRPPWSLAVASSITTATRSWRWTMN